MKQNCKRWALLFLACVLALLTACAAFVYAVDPCFYYRIPDGNAVYFNERYQDAGLAKNLDADTVLLGTSMVANYRASHVEETFGGTAVKLTIPDGYLSEFNTVLQTFFRDHPHPKRVIFGMDVNILIRDESEKASVLPDYLYDRSRLDDLKYLLNKDTLYYSAYTLLARKQGTAEPLDEAFTWDKKYWWNHQTALENYQRPDISASSLPDGAYLKNVDANLAVIESWISAHPDTEFDLFFPPYSILYWDKTERLGEGDAVASALYRICDTLTRYDNVRIYGFLMDTDLVTNLDYYCDYIHYSGAACDQVLAGMAADRYRLTRKNFAVTLSGWQKFVINYHYDQFWDSSFWIQWDQSHVPSA